MVRAGRIAATVDLGCDADADYVARHLRAPDFAEVRAASGRDPRDVVRRSWETSVMRWCLRADGIPAAVFGAARISELSGIGVPWLLGTDETVKNPVEFLRLSKPCLDDIQGRFPMLRNWVDARNAASIRWLKWLGFEVHASAPFGPFDQQFHKFERYQ